MLPRIYELKGFFTHLSSSLQHEILKLTWLALIMTLSFYFSPEKEKIEWKNSKSI